MEMSVEILRVSCLISTTKLKGNISGSLTRCAGWKQTCVGELMYTRIPTDRGTMPAAEDISESELCNTLTTVNIEFIISVGCSLLEASLNPP